MEINDKIFNRLIEYAEKEFVHDVVKSGSCVDRWMLSVFQRGFNDGYDAAMKIAEEKERPTTGGEGMSEKR